MGVLQDLAGPVSQYLEGLSTASQVGVVIGTTLILTVVLNVASQILFRKSNEPPVVFHWFPFIGSTITYGMDPPTFFKQNREKVRLLLCQL